MGGKELRDSLSNAYNTTCIQSVACQRLDEVGPPRTTGMVAVVCGVKVSNLKYFPMKRDEIIIVLRKAEKSVESFEPL